MNVNVRGRVQEVVGGMFYAGVVVVLISAIENEAMDR
jgi:hypothetical protein